MKKLHWIIGIVAFVAIVLWSTGAQIGPPGMIEISFLDVGQGDATLIRSGTTEILIDGGPSREKLISQIEKHIPFFDRTIEAIVITHPDFDHYAGFIEVLNRFTVDAIYTTGITRDTKTYQAFLALAHEKKIPFFRVELGSEVEIAGVADLHILYPFEDVSDYEGRDVNGRSIVMLLDIANIEILMMGDAEGDVEEQLITQGVLQDVEILKVGHHGASAGTTIPFLKASLPEIAVISAGKDNRYGHPKSDVLERLSGISTLRTDVYGTITVRTDGVTMELICEIRCDPE